MNLKKDFWREYGVSFVIGLVATLIVLVTLITAARSQDLVAAVSEPSTVVSLAWLLDLVQDTLVPALATAVASIVGWLLARAGKLVGIQIDQRHNQALHTAIRRGIDGGITMVRSRVGDLEIDVRSVLIAQAARYVERTMPDALKHFGVSGDKLDDLVEAQLTTYDVSNATPVVAPTVYDDAPNVNVPSGATA